ncbi:MAG: PhzF family phenazine biosynthesis protein [Gemmatimonadaceae bacterium]|nr:PhzF family phenazine biosynthesis protein [Gemmatimonadaceae bacterium]NUQ93263.1 PhzF family phenazine biosynthesis protein [Gemmatimonadaceae bacterium]NUR32608.1 PhzF family phenazine biosynthesis protein [Gemmatimonadaceae bacterium]NUS98521.1 PhzF family phenazine biosynthesis protein [Gemmatimonadaceae bacterium]
MPRYRYVTADVFTDKPFGGNQLAVLPDARGLDDERMFALAREFNFSETTFVFPPENGGTRKLRIWTPGGEVPFAGHPTVGSAHVLAAIGEIGLTGNETKIVFEEGVGPVPVTIRSRDGQPVFAQLSVAKLPEIGPPVPTRETLAEMLSLESKDLVGGHFAPQAVSCGLPFVFVPLKDRDAVKRSRIRVDLWERTLGRAWASMIMVFSRDPEREGSDIRARMYAPGISVPEDPATGSACAALGGYLAARDPRQDGTLRWVVEQGFEMGRPSIIEIEVDKRGGHVEAVRVGGASVVMSEGTIEVP